MAEHPVRALDLLLNEPWAIDPPAMEQILSIAQRLNEAPEAVAARLGRPLENTRRVTVRDKTAVIPITGPIFRRANLFTEISGATSVEILARDIQTAIDDPTVARLVLEVDSPGGQATGISELASLIHDSPKPVTAYVDGMAASAAYWLASAAHELVMADTALVGSIGVVASYRPEKDAPLKIISSQSPLKQAAPDTDAGRVEAQRVVDQLAAVFIDAVARYRGTDAETVLADFGQGGVRLGSHAVAVGMADRVGTFESLFSNAGVSGITSRGISMSASTSPEITRETLAAEHPALYQAIVNDAQDTGVQMGVDLERERVTAILQAIADRPHAASSAHAAITAGLSVEQAHAMLSAVPEIITLETFADDQTRMQWRQGFQAETPAAAPTVDSVTGDPQADVGGDPEARARHEWDTNANLRAEFGNDFARYQAFQQASVSGRVKILRAARATQPTPSAA